MHFQYLKYVRQRCFLPIVVSLLVGMMPVVTCRNTLDDTSFRTSGRSSKSRVSSTTGQTFVFVSSTNGSGSESAYQKTSDIAICGFTTLTASQCYTSSVSRSIPTVPPALSSGTQSCGNLSRTTTSQPPSFRSISSGWINVTIITTMSEKQSRGLAHDPGTSTSNHTHEPGSSISKSLKQSLVYSYARVQSTNPGTNLSAFANISSSHTSLSSTSEQPLSSKSNAPSITSTDTLPKAANVTAKGSSARPTSDLQDLSSVFSSQGNTALSGSSGNSTKNSRQKPMPSNTQFRHVSRTGKSSQATLPPSRTPSSFRGASATSGPTIAKTLSMSSVPGFYEILPDGSTATINITTTITSPPTGFSTVSASNSLWTGDTTTVSAGTTYPVIYGCLVCGGKHHGIIITGLGGKRSDPTRKGCGSGLPSLFKSLFGCGTQFTFPPLWGLPPFVVGPLGNPIPLESQPSPDDPEAEEEEKTETLPRATMPRATMSRDTMSRDTMSRDTMSRDTMSRATSPGATSSGATSEATWSKVSSSRASSMAACSVTTTPIPYAIFLINNVSEAELNTLSLYFQEEVGGPDTVGEIPLGVNAGDSMFAGLIDNCVASKIGTHHSVQTVFADVETPWDMDEDTNIETSNLIPRATAPYVTPTKPRLEKRKDTKTTGQPNAQPDLRFISEPKDSTLSSTTDYVFDNSAGVGITVYVIDTGANPSNPDFSGMPGTTRWLWPTESWWNLFLNSAFRQPFGAQTDTANHGCCVISKVAGIFYGVAKRANIVVVKAITSSRPGFEKRILRMSIIKSLSLVQEDVERLAKSTNPQDRVNGKATLNMSFGVALDDTSTTDLWFITKFEQAVQALLALDVVVVIAAGNARGKPASEGGSEDVSTYPALVANRYPDVIVVGAADNNGIEAPTSQHGPLVSVWAPGVDVMCASNASTGNQTLSGTSIAAGMGSGLAAYYLSLYNSLQKPGTGLTSRLVRSRLKSASWARGPTAGFMKAVWNGLSSPVCPAQPVAVGPRMGRRDMDNWESCPGPLTSSSLLSSTLSSTTSSKNVAATTTGLPLPSSIPACRDKTWYDEPETCLKECFDGTCTPVRTRFRRRCEGCPSGELMEYECSCLSDS